ncbi:MAG: hypothetical protein IKA57_05725 [Clostridia bacterium]|nr:hypothetical protein [Clostridia bacterium]
MKKWGDDNEIRSTSATPTLGMAGMPNSKLSGMTVKVSLRQESPLTGSK